MLCEFAAGDSSLERESLLSLKFRSRAKEALSQAGFGNLSKAARAFANSLEERLSEKGR